jgi:hypothetical protein
MGHVAVAGWGCGVLGWCRGWGWLGWPMGEFDRVNGAGPRSKRAREGMMGLERTMHGDRDFSVWYTLLP